MSTPHFTSALFRTVIEVYPFPEAFAKLGLFKQKLPKRGSFYSIIFLFCITQPLGRPTQGGSFICKWECQGICALPEPPTPQFSTWRVTGHFHNGAKDSSVSKGSPVKLLIHCTKCTRLYSDSKQHFKSSASWAFFERQKII